MTSLSLPQNPESETRAAISVLELGREHLPFESETRIEQAEARTEQAKTRTEQAELRAEQAETRTGQAETRTEQAETRTEQAKSRTEQAEVRTEQAETRTEQAIRASELSYRRLFEAAKDGILILDAATGRVSDVNPFLINTLGFSYDELVGRPIWELAPFAHLVPDKTVFERLPQRSYSPCKNLPIETKDGRRIPVEFVSNLYEEDGRAVIQCNIRDITERKHAEEVLCDSETRYRSLVSAVAQIVWMTDSEGRVAGALPSWQEFTGQSVDEILGDGWTHALHSEDAEHALAAWAEALRSYTVYETEYRLRRHDGVYRDFAVRGVPVLTSEGQVREWVGCCTDITKEKEALEQLRWKTAFFEAHVNSALDGILVVDEKGKKILQNQRMVDLWQIPEQVARETDDNQQLEWVTKQNKYPQEFAEKVAYLSSHPDEISRDEIALSSGKVFDRYSAPVRGKDAKHYGRIWSFRDVTDRKQAEEQIAEQAALLDKARDAILVRDLEGTILFWNQGAERMYGWTREEALGRNVSELYYSQPTRFEEANRLTISEGEWSGELQHHTKDQSEIIIEARWTLIRDQDGRPKAILAINSDITEKKKIEAQFMRAQRMESIGTLAGGIAHDLNNILSPIMMSIDLLRPKSDHSDTRELLDIIKASAQRGADIVRQVLSFARGIEGERIEIQPKHVLNDLEQIIKDTFPKDIRMQFSVPNDVWTVLGDPTQMHQVVLNLCVNARDAMPNGGNLTIAVENCVLDEQYAAMNIDAKAGRYVKISVVDSGVGMQPELIDKIFEPFFTTKDLNKGTGLGLSTVMAIVKSHDGLINVYSEPGNGTTFNVYLPAMATSCEPGKALSAVVNLPRGKGETILVVDDEASILTITSQTLQAFGYRVLTATDGADAVGVYALHREMIAVVLTDMMMPVMAGPAMIAALMRINPAVKIIAASGLNANGSTAKASGAGVKHFLPKPYTAETLLKILQRILIGVD